MKLCYVQIPKTLVRRLFEWHGGQRSAVYSVASRAVGGHPVDRKTAKRAERELRVDGAHANAAGRITDARHAFETARQLRARADVCVLSAHRVGRKGRMKKGLSGRKR